MSNDEYGFTEEDLVEAAKKSGGSAIPEGEYEFAIEKAEVKTGKAGPYLKFRLRVQGGPQNNRIVFESYLGLKKKADGTLPKKTASFYRAIGLRPGHLPPGVPGGPDVSALEGVPIKNTVTHEYTTEKIGDNGYPERVLSWSKEGKAFAESKGGKEKIPADKIEAIPGVGFSYSMADSFESLNDGADAAADEQWG